MNKSSSNMTNRKFYAGDVIRHKTSGYVGTIVSGNDADGYSVHYPCDDEEYHVGKDEIEFTNVKSAFLARLQSLLREFDASIYPNGCVVDGIGFKVGDEDIYYDMNYGFGDFITASNIMDFEK